jgi:hypothetical protein
MLMKLRTKKRRLYGGIFADLGTDSKLKLPGISLASSHRDSFSSPKMILTSCTVDRYGHAPDIHLLWNIWITLTKPLHPTVTILRLIPRFVDNQLNAEVPWIPLLGAGDIIGVCVCAGDPVDQINLDVLVVST